MTNDNEYSNQTVKLSDSSTTLSYTDFFNIQACEKV